DTEVSKAVRERVVRVRPIEGGGGGIVTIPVRGGAPSGVPTPGTAGTLEGRVNRGADGTIPRTESPMIGRDGRTTHIDDPATGLRRGDTPTGTTTPAGSTNSTPTEWRRGRAVDGSGVRRGHTSQTSSADTTHRDTMPV